MVDDKKTTTDAKAAGTSKSKVVRSPQWPFLTFTDAVTKAKVIYQQEKRHSTTADVIYTHLGFKTKTGPAGRTLSALQQYGLLDENDGQYKISDKAFRLFNLPEDSPERDVIRKELAVKPRLFKEILAKYPDALPSDATLKSYLILDKNFNENTVEQFIKILKAAINVAKPFDGDYTADTSDIADEDDSEDEEGSRMETPTAAQGQSRGSAPPTPPANKGQAGLSIQQIGQKPLFQYSVPLSIQRDVNAQLVITGTSLKRRDLEVLANKVKDLLDAFEEEEPEPTKEAKPRVDTDKFFDNEPEASQQGRRKIDLEDEEV